MMKYEQLLERIDSMIKKAKWPGDIYTYPHANAFKKVNVDIEKLWEKAQDINLYVHIPFCAHKCSYCGLLSCAVGKNGCDTIDTYLLALEREIKFYCSILPKSTHVTDIFIGGGTPNILNFDQQKRLIHVLEDSFNFSFKEIRSCFECNPELISEAQIKLLTDLGVQRISVGMQSFKQDELELSNRAFDPPQIEKVANWCHKYDLDFNLDLIMGLPNQTADNLWYNLEKAIALNPQSITVYQFEVVRGTPFSKQDINIILDNRMKYELYPSLITYMESHGYIAQSNNSFIRKKDLQPKMYLKVGSMDPKIPTLGLGAGARSYAEDVHYGMRYSVEPSLVREIIKEYISTEPEDLQHFGVTLSLDEKKRKYVILTLTDGGIDLNDYNNRFQSDFKKDFKDEFLVLKDKEFIQEKNQEIFLTKMGLTYADIIAMLFCSMEMQKRYNQALIMSMREAKS